MVQLLMPSQFKIVLQLKLFTMEKAIVGSGILSLYNNRTASIKLNGNYKFTSLRLEVCVLNSPYLKSNLIKIDAESGESDHPVVMDVVLENNFEPFIQVEHNKLPFHRMKDKNVNKINFYCDYDIDLEVRVVKSR